MGGAASDTWRPQSQHDSPVCAANRCLHLSLPLIEAGAVNSHHQLGPHLLYGHIADEGARRLRSPPPEPDCTSRQKKKKKERETNKGCRTVCVQFLSSHCWGKHYFGTSRRGLSNHCSSCLQPFRKHPCLSVQRRGSLQMPPSFVLNNAMPTIVYIRESVKLPALTWNQHSDILECRSHGGVLFHRGNEKKYILQRVLLTIFYIYPLFTALSWSMIIRDYHSISGLLQVMLW